MTHVSYIRAAYIEPIRTVMLVDENFLSTNSMCDLIKQLAEKAEAGKYPDMSKLELVPQKELWEASRFRKWTCDVVAGPDFSIELLQGADLIVLDYHLTSNDNADDSIRIIQGLSTSSRSNLVIVYTNEQNLDDAKRRIAARLRGSTSTHDKARQDLIDDNAISFASAISGGLIDKFLRADTSYRQAPEIRNFLTERKFSDDIIDTFFDNYLEESLRATPVESPRALQLSTVATAQYWVQCGNVFVTLVKKTEHKGGAVFEELERALEDWKPPPLVASLARARHLITEGGFSLDSNFLERDPDLHVGWIVHALPARGQQSAAPESLRQLFARALSQAHDEVLDKLSAHASEWLLHEQGDPLDRAIALARVPQRVPTNVYLALNAYMCSQPFRGKHVTTGTVFQCADSDDHYWVCVTPACDMEIRDKEVSAARDIRAMSVLKLQKVAPAKIEKALKDIFHLRHVFIRGPHDRLIVLEAIKSDTARSLETETMYARNLAAVKNGAFSVVWIREEALKQLFSPLAPAADAGAERQRSIEQAMVVVGQLRESYANRLLQEAGNYNARIGIDFAKRPSDTGA